MPLTPPGRSNTGLSADGGVSVFAAVSKRQMDQQPGTREKRAWRGYWPDKRLIT
jgi:hypothetical protein